MTDQALTGHDSVDAPTAMVLVLHGGKDRSRAPVTRRSLSWQRGAALGRTLGRRLHDAGVGVRLLRYRSVGWNGDGADKIADAYWALDTIRDAVGEVPVVLVGHSMGARAAVRAAGHPAVAAVAGLAPWLPPGEPAGQLAGRRVLLAHGSADSITSPAETWAFLERARAVTEVSAVEVRDGDHAMLRRARLWHAIAAEFARAALALPSRDSALAVAVTATSGSRTVL